MWPATVFSSCVVLASRYGRHFPCLRVIAVQDLASTVKCMSCKRGLVLSTSLQAQGHLGRNQDGRRLPLGGGEKYILAITRHFRVKIMVVLGQEIFFSLGSQHQHPRGLLAHPAFPIGVDKKEVDCRQYPYDCNRAHHLENRKSAFGP